MFMFFLPQAQVVEPDFGNDVEIEEEIPEETDEVFEWYQVQEKAQFKGGEDSLFRYIAKNIRYPQHAIDVGLSATVIIQFVVNQDGSVSDLKSIRPVDFAPFEEEAIRVMKTTSGMWTPAKQRDQPTRMRMMIPIRFALK